MKHLEEKRIGYFAHLRQAWWISLRMFYGGVACFVHGLVPDWFTTTASDVAADVLYSAGLLKKTD